MRRHVKDMAELLYELADPEKREDASSILKELKEESEAASKLTECGTVLKEALRELGLGHWVYECDQVRSKSEQQAEKYDQHAENYGDIAAEKARQERVNTSISCVSTVTEAAQVSVGTAAAIGGTAAVAEIPVLGSMLTTTSVGWFTTTTAINPVMAGVAISVCAGVAVAKAMRNTDAASECKEFEKRKKAAEKDAEESRAEAMKAKQCQKLARDLQSKTKLNLDLWRGIMDAADDFAGILKSIGRMIRREKEVSVDRLKECGSLLVNYVQASSH